MSQVTEISQVTREWVKDIAEREYPEGVVSVYATVDFTDPTSVITAVRSQLKGAFAGAKASAPDEVADRLDRIADRIDEEVQNRIGQPPHHESVVAFVDIAGEHEDEWAILEVPSITHAWYGDHPVVTPILRAMTIAAPTGVVTASGMGAVGAVSVAHRKRRR